MASEDKDLIDMVNETIAELKETATKGNQKVPGLGAAVLVGVAAAETGLAAEIGACLVAATGVTVAAPVIALGLGYIAYKAYNKPGRYAVRKLADEFEKKARE